MAFDDATRARLQRFAAAARALLTEEFAHQLQQDYGLDPSTGDVAALDSLADHDDRRLETARILSVHHAALISFNATPAIKIIENDRGVAMIHAVQMMAVRVRAP
jgi:hypothetical protein